MSGRRPRLPAQAQEPGSSRSLPAPTAAPLRASPPHVSGSGEPALDSRPDARGSGGGDTPRGSLERGQAAQGPRQGPSGKTALQEQGRERALVELT